MAVCAVALMLSLLFTAVCLPSVHAASTSDAATAGVIASTEELLTSLANGDRQQAAERFALVKKWWTQNKATVKQQSLDMSLEIDRQIAAVSIALLNQDAQRAAEEKLSVRDVEGLARRKSKRSSKRPANDDQHTANADIAAVQGHLEDFLGMSVRIATDRSPQQGTVTIRYRTLDQLDLLCQRLTGGDI